jgi:hypothetical protein
MSVHHEWRSQLVNKRKDDIHVLDSLVKSNECFPVLDVFVLWGLWVALLGLHVLDKLHEDLSVNFLPQSGLPSLELEIDQRDQIPHLLKKAKLSSAIFKLLVR